MALHRYFIWSDVMRLLMDQIGERQGWKVESTSQAGIRLFHFMSYWYAGLYVVIEGWRELGLHDDVIDELLESPHVKLLRRYRNGAFHYQRKYFDDRFMDFMKPGAPAWIRSVRHEFSRWFLAYTNQNKGKGKR